MREGISDKEYNKGKGPEVGDVLVVQDCLVWDGGSWAGAGDRKSYVGATLRRTVQAKPSGCG